MSKPRKLYTRTVYLFFAFLAFVTRGNKHCVHKKLLYGALILGIGGQFGCGQKEFKSKAFNSDVNQVKRAKHTLKYINDTLNKQSSNKPTQKESSIIISSTCYDVAEIPEMPLQSTDTFEIVDNVMCYLISHEPVNDEKTVHILMPETTLALNEDKITATPEISAEFPGGKKALNKFLKQNLTLPDSVTHKVFVKFIVEKDGHISNPEIIGEIHKALENEVLRVVSLMPLWEAARVNNLPVRSFVILPVILEKK